MRKGRFRSREAVKVSVGPVEALWYWMVVGMDSLGLDRDRSDKPLLDRSSLPVVVIQVRESACAERMS